MIDTDGVIYIALGCVRGLCNRGWSHLRSLLQFFRTGQRSSGVHGSAGRRSDAVGRPSRLWLYQVYLITSQRYTTRNFKILMLRFIGSKRET